MTQGPENARDPREGTKAGVVPVSSPAAGRPHAQGSPLAPASASSGGAPDPTRAPPASPRPPSPFPPSRTTIHISVPPLPQAPGPPVQASSGVAGNDPASPPPSPGVGSSPQ